MCLCPTDIDKDPGNDGAEVSATTTLLKIIFDTILYAIRLYFSKYKQWTLCAELLSLV